MAGCTATCVFCEIVARRAPASFVHEDESVVAFMDIRPVNPGHLLVIPRRHLESLNEIDEEIGSRLFDVARNLQAAIRASGVRCEGINLFVADGEVAGQEVFHAHVHVVPRFAGDTFRVTADWPSPRPRDELDTLAALVRKATLVAGPSDDGSGRAPLTRLGLADDEVRVEPYDQSWPERFVEICALIRPAAPDARIEHIGSTSPSELWDLVFRDFMRKHPKDVVAYGAMKHQAAIAGDRTAYSRAKAPFIDSISPRIRKWARDSGWASPVDA